MSEPEKSKRKWVVVFETHSDEIAQIIAGSLQDAGIETVAIETSIAFGGMIGLGNVIRVFVDAEDEQDALAIIEADDEEENPHE
jgi:translation initiation factor 2B subunit (eIF-2B alpha/beta/delta family)